MTLTRSRFKGISLHIPLWPYCGAMTCKCKVCGATDKDAEFYTSLKSRCKECHKRSVRENRAANVDHYRAYDAKRYNDDPRVKARCKRYQATEAGRESARRSSVKWQAQNPEKRAAHVILGHRVEDGKIIKPDRCQCCNRTASRIHGHHEDYTQPLNVIWCCSECHRQIHQGGIEVTIIDGKFTPDTGGRS